MPKRKIAPDSYSYDDDEDYVPSKSVKYSALDEVPGKKKAHTLDSDEEEEDHDAGNDVADKSSNILQENDIEGQEAPTIAFEGETTITPFNMKEEMEDGHFDGEGFYHFKKDSEQIKDAWLDDIDWVKVKHVEDNKNKYGSDDESDDSQEKETSQGSEAGDSDSKQELVIYEQLLEHLKPEETVQKALKVNILKTPQI
ncbi:hypothetical protein FHG87_023403 [Trinorchestia longiramus]|nr:hypothetical protein FHG87_023403 [Trinorchestia longiramus]